MRKIVRCALVVACLSSVFAVTQSASATIVANDTVWRGGCTAYLAQHTVGGCDISTWSTVYAEPWSVSVVNTGVVTCQSTSNGGNPVAVPAEVDTGSSGGLWVISLTIANATDHECDAGWRTSFVNGT